MIVFLMIIWIVVEALIIWLLLSGNEPPKPPVCYGESYIVRPDRNGDKDNPNFYRR